MKVCIAEKPSVAREIANVVGASSRKDGYFEGNGYAVTWTFGHFCTLYSPDDYRPDWKRWSLNTLPMLPEKFMTKLMKDTGVKKQFAVIKKLFKQASLVINCGDAGQEGELIQRWVIKEAKYKGKVERLWISSLTKEAVVEGFKKLRPASDFDKLFHAGSARAIGDWLLGMNATRLYTLKYGGGKQVLSIGRVQTPTLAMLVKRHLEITNFVSQPFWELETCYREVIFRYEKGRFLKIEDGEATLEKIKDEPFTIISSKKKKGKEYAPKLFDLTGLQVYCNKRFSLSADQTLKIVQKLYEQKVVTYPRVDTTFLPNDVYPKIANILGRLTNYSQLTAPLLGKTIRKSNRVFNDKKVTDHHAIIPTGVQTGLMGDASKVYDAIVRRFLANFYPDCIVNNAVVIGESAGLQFKAKGKEIVDPGWKVVYPKSKKQSNTEDETKNDNKEKILPPFVEGESGPHTPSLVSKNTQPPKYYTDGTLLRAMETAGKTVENEELSDLMKENGIGRPSTRANIIETLFRRKYAFRQKKTIKATDLGVQLIDTIQNHLLKSVELTGQWEKKLRLIESGEYNTIKFIGEMKKMTDDLVTEVRSSNALSKIDLSKIPDKRFGKYSKSKSTASKKETPTKPAKKAKKQNKKSAVIECTCPKCNKGNLLKGSTAYGCSQWKAGCTFRLPFTFMEKKISDIQLIRLLQKGCTVSLKGFKSEGQKVNGLVRFNDQFGLVLEEPKTKEKIAKKPAPAKEVLTCPKCKKGTILKGKTAYGCSNWQSGCNYRFLFAEVKKQVAGQPVTKELVRKILMNG